MAAYASQIYIPDAAMPITIKSTERVIMTHIEKQLNEFIGKKLRSVRGTLGVTQEVIGKEIGVTPQQVQKYENGSNRLSAARLFMLSQAVDVPVQYFFPHDEGQRQEAIAPQTVRVVRMLNRIPSKHYDDLSNVIRSILKISLNTEDISIEKLLDE
jgi:transcriptional regulator with XRE-family HTH domain